MHKIYNPLYAVSACLVGYSCRYDGSDKKNDLLLKDLNYVNIIPVCPEIFGGLPVPRPYCSIIGGDGLDVLRGTASVIASDGIDLTSFFLKGAYITFGRIKTYGIKRCFFKSKSPSCGSGLPLLGLWGRLHDGYKRTLGITTALVLSAGITVVEI